MFLKVLPLLYINGKVVLSENKAVQSYNLKWTKLASKFTGIAQHDSRFLLSYNLAVTATYSTSTLTPVTYMTVNKYLLACTISNKVV